MKRGSREAVILSAAKDLYAAQQEILSAAKDDSSPTPFLNNVPV